MWLGKGRVTESLQTWLLPTQFASPFLAVACRVRPLWHYFSFSHTPVSPPFANHPVCLQGEFGRYVWEGFHKGFAALCEGGLILVSCGSAPVPATASVGGIETRFAMCAPCDMPECARRGCLRGFIPVICFSLFSKQRFSTARSASRAALLLGVMPWQTKFAPCGREPLGSRARARGICNVSEVRILDSRHVCSPWRTFFMRAAGLHGVLFRQEHVARFSGRLQR